VVSDRALSAVTPISLMSRIGTPAFSASFPINFLLELDYAGNRGLGLLAPNLISRFPKPLFQPGNQVAFTTQVASPTAGQTPTDAVVGPTQSLASSTPNALLWDRQRPWH